MKCPYRKETIIQPEIRDGEKIRFERHTEEFCDCYQEECPFFMKQGPAVFGTYCGKTITKIEVEE